MTAPADPTELLLIVDGDLIVVRPDDTVLLRARTPITAETASNLVTALQEALGRGRFAVIDDTFDIVVQRAHPPDPLDDSGAQLAAIDFHHQQTAI
jgi:hypothetical protein